jgi:hypothetical protein
LTARIILSLSALAASLLAGSGTPVSHPAHNASIRLLHPRLLCFAATFAYSVSEHSSPALAYPHTPAAALSLTALTATAYRRSLWLVTSLVAIDSIERLHQRELLRC